MNPLRLILGLGVLLLLTLIPEAVQAQMTPPSAAAARNPAAPAGPATAQPTMGQTPFPPLPPEHQKFLDDVLQLWQQRSQSIQRYRCTFKRWEYDPVFGPRDTFKTYSEGVIKYATPDKGLFKVEKMMEYVAAAEPGGRPQYQQRDSESNEHWICDGQSVFSHDPASKQQTQTVLPPEMRGKAIADGPLPFLFGADAEQIKQRYWIRPLPMPPDVKGEYWLEAFPKRREDAANYSKVHVIIDHKDFLPKGLVIFDRNFDPASNPARSTFTFEQRESNWSIALQQLKFWEREFYEPKVPAGWKRVVEQYDSPSDPEQFAPAAPAGPQRPTTQATRPAPDSPLR
jgi:TIGR03009 family protein